MKGMKKLKPTDIRSANQHLFNALVDVASFYALESDMAEILNAVDKDRAEQRKAYKKANHHKWKDNKCTKCGIQRQIQVFIILGTRKTQHQYIYTDGKNPIKHSTPLCEPKQK